MVLHSLPNLNSLDKQLVDNVRCRTMPHIGVQIWVSHRKNLRSRYTALTSNPKANPTDIYPNACYLFFPWNPTTLETQHDYQPDRFSGHFRRPRKRSAGIMIITNV
ncbi:unnamed protein product [Hymenolepis diminuta]|uniref:Uncharacterized protein n=1 Tax=Hymenolepis diminuta TaxID=6216 RepID=A0A564YJD3_HYMDI|nr:unnamed protein product [Hymenolepis diminuta]